MASGTWATPPTQSVGGSATAADQNTIRDDLNAAFGNKAEVRISRVAGQAISTTTQTSISFDTETTDTDGFFAPTSTTVTVPTGLGGRYLITFVSTWTGSVTTRTFTQLLVGGRRYTIASNGTETIQTATINQRLAAADTIQCAVFQQSGSTVGCTAFLEMERTAI